MGVEDSDSVAVASRIEAFDLQISLLGSILEPNNTSNNPASLVVPVVW